MTDDIQYMTPDEGDASPETELKELHALQQELSAAGGDSLSQQAIENANARIEELKKDNPGLH